AVHKFSKRPNKFRLNADCRYAMIRRYASCLGKSAIIEIELNERFRMLRDKRNRRHNERKTSLAGPPNFLVGQRTDPFQRPDPALVADAPIEVRPAKNRDNCRCGLCYLVWIGVTLAHDPIWQAMCGQQ